MKKQPTKKIKKIRYELACGNNLQKGFTGIDITKEGTQAKIAMNVLEFPWKLESNSVDELFCAHFVEHIPHGTDGFHDPFWDFFNEAWRVLKPGGIFTIVTPYYTSIRASQDPTHQRFISEMTYFYLSKEWRKLNKLEHYPIHTDFQTIKIDHAVSEEFTGRAVEAIQYAGTHNWNVINDIVVVLQKPHDSANRSKQLSKRTAHR